MLRVGIFSESAFTIGGHGVHTAFIECQKALRQAPTVQLVNPWLLRPSDILHVHSAGPIALAVLLRHPGPKVVSAHLTGDSFIGSISKAEYCRAAIDSYLKYFYEQADIILAVGASTKDYLQRQLGIDTTIRTLPNTIDGVAIHNLRSRREQLRTKFGWTSHRPVILGVGQVQPRKGIDDFIETAEEMPSLDFVWVGGFLFGPLSADRHRLKEAIEAAPENLRFTGPIPRQQVFEYYTAADIFLLPSHQETFGLSILEAAMAGLPLILQDLSSYRSIFNDSYLPVADGNYKSAILALLSDPGRLTLCRRKARAAAASYESQNRLSELLDAYRLAKEISGQLLLRAISSILF
jgi:1,2-diacylglycerol-3-alpha-glucose alpha-1,2-galactosyltransferase